MQRERPKGRRGVSPVASGTGVLSEKIGWVESKDGKKQNYSSNIKNSVRANKIGLLNDNPSSMESVKKKKKGKRKTKTRGSKLPEPKHFNEGKTLSAADETGIVLCLLKKKGKKGVFKERIDKLQKPGRRQ